MLQALMSLIARCWKPFGLGDDANAGRECKDGLLWFRDIGRFAAGDFSMAVVQANQVLEDQSQIESGPFGTFVGVYDGHGGPDCSRYVCDNLFRNLQVISAFREFIFAFKSSCAFQSSQESRTVERCVLVLICVGDLLEPFVCCYCLRSGVCAAAILAESHSVVTSEVIQQAFRRTEEGFTALVSELWSSRPQIATTGTCCLVGVICRQTLFVASLGDSRAVLGRRVGNTGGMAAMQLSTEHNANIEAVRQELKELHPDDPQIVVLRHGVWRVKGIIQVISGNHAACQILVVGILYLVFWLKFPEEGIWLEFWVLMTEPFSLGLKREEQISLYISHSTSELPSRLSAFCLSISRSVSNEVSRSIGDVYMKHAQFNREPINAKFRLPEPMNMPFLSANPTVISHPIQPNDSFLIFASDGLWEHLSNDQAVDIVHSSPRAGSAKRLIKAALQEAARKREMRYSDLYKIDKKVRRHFHDDITVIVLFLNHDLISRGAVLNSPLTVRSALDH
ncbi:hypothetical protein V8G54_033105 [Vigna mungo]